MNFKKIIKLSLIASTMLITPQLSALDLADQSYELQVKQNMVNLVNKQYKIFEALDLYFARGGDIKSSSAEYKTAIATYLNLTTQDQITEYFKGLNNETIDITFDTLTFTSAQQGILSQISSNQNLLDLYTQAANAKDLNIVGTNLYYKVSDEAKKIITLKQTMDASKVVISNTQPTDTSKIWIDTSIAGEPITRYYYNSQYNEVKKTKNDCYWLEDKTLEDTIKAIMVSGECIEVSQDGTYTTKIYNSISGELESSSSSSSGSSLYSGTGTIVDMAITKFNSSGTSEISAVAPTGEYRGDKPYTKHEDTTVGGYWQSADNLYIVTDTIESLNYLSSHFLAGTTAWIAKGTNAVYKLQKKTLPDFSIQWVYIAKDYEDVLNFDQTKNSNGDGTYIYITDHNEYVTYNTSTKVFEPLNGSTYITKDPSARDAFYTESGNTYLTQINDCDSYSCNGDSSSNYFAGTKIDNLYPFYYSNSGKNKNNLTDATPSSSWATFWNDQLSAVQYNGSQFGDIPTGSILVKTTLNGHIAYTYNGQMINKANGYIIPQNKLPAGLTADTVTITKSGSTNYVNVSNLDNFVTDTNLDVDYPVNLTGSGYSNKKLKQCTPYGSNNLWSDDCNNPSSASVAVTNGSRSDLPSPSSTSRVNLTKQVGSEPNYTTNGVSYSNDAGYKQWFKSTSGTITNNMLDAYKTTTPYADATAKSIGYAVNNNTVGKYNVHGKGLWTLLSDSSKVLVDHFASTWSGNINEIAGAANNGLIYTRDDISPFTSTYRIDNEFGVTSWSGSTGKTSRGGTANWINDHDNSTNICASRGMRLPTIAETKGSSNPWGGNSYLPSGGAMGNSNGVPSNSHGWTWTASSFTSNTDDYWRWNDSSAGHSYYSYGRYVRCVR